MALASQTAAVDVVVSSIPRERLGKDISHCLAVKGFCIIQPNVEDQHFRLAVAEARELAQQGRLEQPPAMIVDGLLGLQGSARITDLGLPDGEDPDRLGGETLAYLDAELTELGMAAMPYLPLTLGEEVKSRTAGVLHEAGSPLDEGPDLTGEVCAKWINIFAHHRIMCIWVLGPDRGSLELQPFDEESNSAMVPMHPGTLVMLRPDALQHKYTTAGKAYCLTCFFQKDARHRKHRLDRPGDNTPCCQALEAWALDRIREYKESFPEEQAKLSLPRSWEQMANHTSFVGQHIAVRTASVRQVSSWDPLTWTALFWTGPDCVKEVPLSRWDHRHVYEAEGEGTGEFRGKTSCRHGAFIEGVEYFDNVMFRISKVEAQGMDPGHRLILETGYEALYRDGYKTSKLMNSRGGVYVANPQSTEWSETERDMTGAGVCGGGGSIACGRFSFTHGMKGPCISVDVEAASSLVAVNLASANLCRVGNWEPIPFALCTTFNLQLNPRTYVFGTVRRTFSSVGRVMAFDAHADGYVRGDSTVSLVLKALTDIVEDDVVVSEQGGFLGVLAGSASNQSGRRAHLSAPDSAAFQEVIAECIRQADISPLDVDACDVFADGQLMGDAIEASATARAFRPDGMADLDSAPLLALLASKTPVGNQLESSGLSSIVRVVLAAQLGLLYPNLHLRRLNPYVDLDMCERPAFIAGEALEYSLESCYTGIANRSHSGTNCHVLVWGQLTQDSGEVEAGEPRPVEKLAYWPEGGGELPEELLPKKGYSVVGTWNQWKPQPMQQEGAGVWGYTLTLGPGRLEAFVLALDGSDERVLHPEYPGAGKGARVVGPGPPPQGGECWVLDARGAAGEVEAGDLAPYGLRDEEDVGQPGDRYRIRLRLKGKWRTVEWEKLSRDKPGADD